MLVQRLKLPGLPGGGVGRVVWMRAVVVYLLLLLLLASIIYCAGHIFTHSSYPSDFPVDQFLPHIYNQSAPFPKIMHHCWKNETIPDVWMPGYKACSSLNPEYTHMLWTHEKIDNFFRVEYPWFFDRFMAYEHRTQKLDVFRYFVLYHYGGVYLDLDLPCKVPFVDILGKIPAEYDMVIPDEYFLMVRSDFIATKKHHPLFKLAISNLPFAFKRYSLHYMDVMAGTGPFFFTRCIENFPGRNHIYHLPMNEWKHTYFEHPTSMFWANWWERWILNSWMGWIFTFITSFSLVTFFVAKFSENGAKGKNNLLGTNVKRKVVD